jgi:P-type Ca2+ transporter type 2C
LKNKMPNNATTSSNTFKFKENPFHTEGLTTAQVHNSRKQHGYNELPTSKPKSLWSIAWEVMKEPMFLLLISCATLYLFLGDWQEGILVASSVLVVVGITFYQERKTERALEAIRDLSSPRALVIRDGEAKRIAGSEVVVGDMVVLKEGDRIPADGKIISNINMTVDESLLTGESVAVAKTNWQETQSKTHSNGSTANTLMDNTHLVFSGTMVVQGQGIAQITAVGVQTEIGKIGKSLESVVEEKTLLQKEIRSLVRVFAILGSIVCIIGVLTFGILRGHWLEGILAGISTAMAMLPEEFPVVLTVFMALGAWRMSRKNVLARKTATIETLGSATVLCTDKTGTLTQNKMSVNSLYAHEALWDFTQKDKQILPESFHELVEYGILAGQTDPFDPMEKAILALVEKKLVEEEHLHDDWQLVQEYPLSKDLLAMSRVFKKQNDERQYAVAAKGAPEAILDLCHIAPNLHADMTRVVANMAEQGLRILGVAKATFDPKHLPTDQHNFDFTFLGFIGLSDPIRDEVPKAIQECYDAGIRVIMITGDYAVTAQNIARQIGLKNAESVITGQELAAMNDEILRGRIQEVNIFSRVIPEQKLRLVQALKSNNEIVAMTGDGVNDAPALKAANIGIAMGGKGTDVAREAAALVLLDDNFASIVHAVKMGRRIFDNLQKAMIYIMAIHIPLVGLSIFPMLTPNLPLMLLPVLMALMELIIDPACSIVFEMEAAEKDIMQKPPRRLKERFFSWRKMIIALAQGTGVFIAIAALYALGLWWKYDEKTLRSMVFTALMIANLSLILTNRTLKRTILESLFRDHNPTVKWLIGGVLSFIFLILYVPIISPLFRVTPLNILDFLIAVLVGMISIAWFEIFKTYGKNQTA